jgi:hypothetical protein
MQRRRISRRGGQQSVGQHGSACTLHVGGCGQQTAGAHAVRHRSRQIASASFEPNRSPHIMVTMKAKHSKVSFFISVLSQTWVLGPSPGPVLNPQRQFTQR